MNRHAIKTWPSQEHIGIFKKLPDIPQLFFVRWTGVLLHVVIHVLVTKLPHVIRNSLGNTCQPYSVAMSSLKNKISWSMRKHSAECVEFNTAIQLDDFPRLEPRATKLCKHLRCTHHVTHAVGNHLLSWVHNGSTEHFVAKLKQQPRVHIHDCFCNLKKAYHVSATHTKLFVLWSPNLDICWTFSAIHGKNKSR